MTRPRVSFNVWALLLLVVAIYILAASHHFEPSVSRVIANIKTGQQLTQYSFDGGKTWVPQRAVDR